MLSQFNYQQLASGQSDGSLQQNWYDRLTTAQQVELKMWYFRLILNNENYLQVIPFADQQELIVLRDHKANFAMASEALPVLKPADITFMYKLGKLIINRETQNLQLTNPEAVNGFEKAFRAVLNLTVVISATAAIARPDGHDMNSCDCGHANCDNCCNPETLLIPAAASTVVILAAGTTAYSVSKFLKALSNIIFHDQKKMLKSSLRIIVTPMGYVIGMVKGGSIGASFGMPVLGTVIGGILGAGLATSVSKYTSKLISMAAVHLGFFGPLEFVTSSTNPSKYPATNTTTAKMFTALRTQKNAAGFVRHIPCTTAAVETQQYNDLCAQMRRGDPEWGVANGNNWIHGFFWNHQTESWDKVDQNAIQLEQQAPRVS